MRVPPPEHTAYGNDDTIGFWDHVEQLRGITLVVATIFAVAMVCFIFAMPWLYDHVILYPCSTDFPTYRLMDWISGVDTKSSHWHLKLVNINLGAQLMQHLTMSMWGALFITLPLAVIAAWRFVSPGLYRHELRPVGKALWLGTVMFYVGVAIAYWIVFPVTLRFLSDYSLSPDIANSITLESYADTLTSLCLTMGIVAELPSVAWILSSMGLLKRKHFNHWRRHAIVVLLILAAIVTPTADPLTMLVVFVPLYGLWELSAVLCSEQSQHS